MSDPHDYTSFELVDLLSEFNFSKRSYEMVNRIEKEKRKKKKLGTYLIKQPVPFVAWEMGKEPHAWAR